MIKRAGSAQFCPTRAAVAANSAEHPNSTSGYRREIGDLQLRHLPFKRIQEITGTLSRSRIGVEQFGQAERGVTIESFLGTR